jgi:hypothetical protein
MDKVKIMLSLCLSPTLSMHIGEVNVKFHTILTLASDRWSFLHSDHFMPIERTPGIHWLRGWVCLLTCWELNL